MAPLLGALAQVAEAKIDWQLCQVWHWIQRDLSDICQELDWFIDCPIHPFWCLSSKKADYRCQRDSSLFCVCKTRMYLGFLIVKGQQQILFLVAHECSWFSVLKTWSWEGMPQHLLARTSNRCNPLPRALGGMAWKAHGYYYGCHSSNSIQPSARTGLMSPIPKSLCWIIYNTKCLQYRNMSFSQVWLSTWMMNAKRY